LITTVDCCSAGAAACGVGGADCPCPREETGAKHIAPAASHAPNGIVRLKFVSVFMLCLTTIT
jgi:hypothetical protein